MKKILRTILIEAVALYLTSLIAKGMIFEKGLQSLVMTAIALSFASIFVRPVINILLLPINLVTFNLFRFIASAITLFIIDLILSEFQILFFSFNGLNSPYLFLPPINIPIPLAYVAFSIMISTIAGIFHWLVR